MSSPPSTPEGARAGEKPGHRVSFVLPAWNEELLLPRALQAIHRAARDVGISYEVIVADDNSSDRTAEIARAEGAEVISCDHRQIAATRNSGARAANGDLLIFVDADTEVTPEVVLGAVDAIDGGAVYGGADITWDGIPLWSRMMLRMTLFMYRFGKLAPGAFFFCTREAFERAGGFDETLFAAEEYYLAKELKRIGRHAWIEHQVVTSGRKLRAHSARELFRESARLMFGGKRSLQRRENAGLWYEPRKQDPGTQIDQ